LAIGDWQVLQVARPLFAYSTAKGKSCTRFVDSDIGKIGEKVLDNRELKKNWAAGFRAKRTREYWQSLRDLKCFEQQFQSFCIET
jgi:hypothetical protein